MFRGGEDERKAYDQAIAAFEKQTGAKVNYETALSRTLSSRFLVVPS